MTQTSNVFDHSIVKIRDEPVDKTFLCHVDQYMCTVINISNTSLSLDTHSKSQEGTYTDVSIIINHVCLQNFIAVWGLSLLLLKIAHIYMYVP